MKKDSLPILAIIVAIIIGVVSTVYLLPLLKTWGFVILVRDIIGIFGAIFSVSYILLLVIIVNVFKN